MARISALGLDIGRRRVGIAGCDGTGLIATGLDTLYRHRHSFGEDVAFCGRSPKRARWTPSWWACPIR